MWYFTLVFVCISLMISEVEHFFIYLLPAPLDVLFWKNILGPFFFQLCYLSSLCILDINFLTDIWVANIFSVVFSFWKSLSLLYKSFLVWINPICLFLLLFPWAMMSWRIIKHLRALEDLKSELKLAKWIYCKRVNNS